MPEFYTITFIIIALAAISPGPDFAIVVKNSLQYNRKAGIFTALGVSTSLLIHSSYCILGLAIIISKSLLLFNIIKYIGAAYLIYIGIKSLLTKRKDLNQIKEQAIQYSLGAWKLFLQGLLCNLLNPKAIMFILAFFTLIIKPTTSWLEKLILAIEIVMIHLIWFSWLAIMITHPSVQKKLVKIEFYIIKLMGIILIIFGTHIALLHHM